MLKRLAIFGVSLLVLIAVLIVLPKIGQAPGAIASIVAAPIPAAQQTTPTPATGTKAPATALPSAKHTITVKFDYDFGRSPACSAKITAKCVQQFNIYDISGGSQNRVKIFSLPVPPGASGQMRGITGTSPQLSFEPGRHVLGVVAQWPDGKESDPIVCQTSVEINP